MMAWAKEEAAKGTQEFNKQKEKVSVEFSPLSRIPLNESVHLMQVIYSCKKYAAN